MHPLLRLFALFAFVHVLSHPARAATGPCDAAARSAAQATGVPVDLLRAITLTETRHDGGPWPWTINHDGQGSWLPDRDAAVQAAAEILAAGGDADLGCFQINTRWHGSAFASLDEMMDPDRNALYAADFLLRLYSETGAWEEAVAAYHSRDPDRGLAYVARVGTALASLGEGGGAMAQAAPDAPAENGFPLLLAGTPASPGSLVPRVSGLTPLIGAP